MVGKGGRRRRQQRRQRVIESDTDVVANGEKDGQWLHSDQMQARSDLM